MDYILNQANPKDFNLLLIQEPWLDHLGNSCGTPNWHIVYPPSINQYQQGPICSIILVNTNISTDNYTILDIPCNDITAVHFKGDFGHCSLINVYNDCTNNNTIYMLNNFLSSSVFALFHTSDFTLSHHPEPSSHTP